MTTARPASSGRLQGEQHACSRRCRSVRRRPAGPRRARRRHGDPRTRGCVLRAVEAHDRQAARRVAPVPHLLARRERAAQTVLGGEEAPQIQAPGPEDVDRVAPVAGHRGRMAEEAEPLAPEQLVMAGRHAVETGLNDRPQEENGRRHRRPRAPTTASATSARTWRMPSFSRVGCTRFVSRMTKSRRSGSIQSEVPVKPVWPKDRSERSEPADEYPGSPGRELRGPEPLHGVSQPRARVEPGTPARRVKRSERLTRDDAPLLEYASAQQHLRESRQVARGAEEARVGRHPSQGEGVLVVDFSPQHAAPPGIVLRGCDPGQQLRLRGETRCRPCPAARRPAASRKRPGTPPPPAPAPARGERARDRCRATSYPADRRDPWLRSEGDTPRGRKAPGRAGPTSRHPPSA